MREKIYRILPSFFQEILISIFNIVAYRKRYGKKYRHYLDQFASNEKLSRKELLAIQTRRYTEFIDFVRNNSPFYERAFKGVAAVSDISNIRSLPILTKEDLRQNIKDVMTIKGGERGIVSKTGGTTGKSLIIYFTEEDMQERFALLDNFRGRLGYKLGKRTAWFSGKALLTTRDIRNGRFWKTDRLHSVRYYSTFHLKEEYLQLYVENLLKYRPEYLVGFPSTIMAIAKHGVNNGYSFPEGVVKAIFPTAETITSEMRDVIEPFFKAKMYNQYASSEGAPFIIECVEGNLHLEVQSGVFEVVDDKGQHSHSGKLIVTSFTTHGTPLVRYDIGDTIELDDPDSFCRCGNSNPMVKQILGRLDDYVYSPENGKINLGNVSNTLKETKGILKFQVVQDDLNQLDVYVVIDREEYSGDVERKFINNWRDRVGEKMTINLHIVEDIAVEQSGKYRIVKNNVKHLIG